MKIREGYLVAYSGITGWGIHIYIHKGLIYVYIICVCVSISPPKIKIMTRNLQDMILGVPQGHSWCQGWPCPPCLWSGTPNVLQVPLFLTPPPSWHTSNWDINTKFSGYLPWGKKTSFMTSGMTLSSKSLVRKPQGSPRASMNDPTSWHTPPQICLHFCQCQ